MQISQETPVEAAPDFEDTSLGAGAARPYGGAGGPAVAPDDGLSQRRTWTAGLAVLAASSAVLIALFWPEITAAIQVWATSRTFGHGFLIVPIAAFLFYRIRHRLAALRPRPAPWALVPIAGLTLLWVAGDLVNAMLVKQLAFVGLWQSLFLLVLGWRITAAALFPLAYLFLAVPFGQSVVPLLQDVTAQIVVQLLRWSGMPVFLDGYHIQIPSGSFLVAEACSGVRYLMACIALGILAAALFFRSWPRRLVFVGLSVAVPIAANGLRAYGIVMLAHYSNYQLAVGVDHVVYGFIFLVIVTLSLLGLGTLLSDRDGRSLTEANACAADGPTGPARAAAPGASPSVYAPALCAVAALAIILATQAWIAAAKAPPAAVTPTLVGPIASPPWQLVDEAAPGWSPRVNGMDAMLAQSYRDGTAQVDVHIAYYAFQREGAEAVSDLNTIVDGRAEWKILGSAEREVRLADATIPVKQLVIGKAGELYVVWYWFRIGGENTSSRLLGKLLEAKALITGGERSAAVITLSSPMLDDVERTTERFAAFLEQSLDDEDRLFRVPEGSAGAAPGGGDALPGPAAHQD